MMPRRHRIEDKVISLCPSIDVGDTTTYMGKVSASQLYLNLTCLFFENLTVTSDDEK